MSLHVSIVRAVAGTAMLVTLGASPCSGGPSKADVQAETVKRTIETLRWVHGHLGRVEDGQQLVQALNAPLPGDDSKRMGDLFLDLVEGNISGRWALHDQVGWYPDPTLAALVPFLRAERFVKVDGVPGGKGGNSGPLLIDWSPNNRGIRGVGPGPWGAILTGLAEAVTRAHPQLARQAPALIDQRELTRLILTDRFGGKTAARLLGADRTGLDTQAAARELFARPYKRGSTQIDPTFAHRVFDAATMRALEWQLSGGEVGGYGTPYTGFDRPGPVTVAGKTWTRQAGLDPPRWQGDIDPWVLRMRTLGLWVGMTPEDIAALEAATRRQHAIEAAQQHARFVQGSF